MAVGAAGGVGLDSEDQTRPHAAEAVAEFLMRCLFTFFAEDVRLIADNAFTELLESGRGKPEQFPHPVRQV
jgi:hypothetical protein